MQSYTDVGGDSGVAGYEIGSDSIKVQFKDGSVYLYTHASAGGGSIERMKELAAQGDGLNSYINKFVRTRYAAKLR
jgi:hypothetical protein